jgi:hypothetical protein
VNTYFLSHKRKLTFCNLLLIFIWSYLKVLTLAVASLTNWETLSTWLDLLCCDYAKNNHAEKKPNYEKVNSERRMPRKSTLSWNKLPIKRQNAWKCLINKKDKCTHKFIKFLQRKQSNFYSSVLLNFSTYNLFVYHSLLIWVLFYAKCTYRYILQINKIWYIGVFYLGPYFICSAFSFSLSV